eukprot:CAMPEP_0170084644 /NCGR_PEP_ID=MMETSP0019_2-20121128/19777_1 /TAXON_ID=98059 /ORGANISM="Dinobryon sp., Strain UTEXLB2267" /LENGTH=294 /DNA_ID=CAMNT_0010300811 /DNA_START=14 /DNA_END=898 /DNA_ORIENTATION=+
MILERIQLAMKAALTEEQSAAMEEESFESSNTPSKLKSMKKEETDAHMRLMRWMTIHTHYPAIGKGCSFIVKALKLMKSSVFKFRYTSLGELFHTTSISSSWFAKLFPERIACKVGYFRETYRSFSKTFTDEFASIHSYLNSFLEIKKKNEYNKRINQIMSTTTATSSTSEGSTKASAVMDSKEKQMTETAEKMRRLGVENDASLFEEEPNSPVSFIRSLLEEKNKNDILGLISLELLQHHITGLQSIEVLSGESRLIANVAGVDFVHLLPKIQSMQACQNEHKIRPQAVLAKK